MHTLLAAWLPLTTHIASSISAGYPLPVNEYAPVRVRVYACTCVIAYASWRAEALMTRRCVIRLLG